MTSKLSKLINLVARYPAFPLSLGLAGWLEAILTIEWSFPYCSSQEDGPASAVFGMPLPYIRWSGASSLEYEYMPLILIVNLVIISAIVFPFVSWSITKLASPEQNKRRIMLSLAGFILLSVVGAWTFFLMQIGVYKIPVADFASGYETYPEFRPVKFIFKNLHYECTPSDYWFKNGRRPNRKPANGAAE